MECVLIYGTVVDWHCQPTSQVAVWPLRYFKWGPFRTSKKIQLFYFNLVKLLQITVATRLSEPRLSVASIIQTLNPGLILD